MGTPPPSALEDFETRGASACRRKARPAVGNAHFNERRAFRTRVPLPNVSLLQSLHFGCRKTNVTSWCLGADTLDHSQQYNEGTTGAYCAACCSNTDASGDTWTFSCPLDSTAFADFVNHFGWEFRKCRGCGSRHSSR